MNFLPDLSFEDVPVQEPWRQDFALADMGSPESSCDYCATMHRDSRCPSCGAPKRKKKYEPFELRPGMWLYPPYNAQRQMMHGRFS